MLKTALKPFQKIAIRANNKKDIAAAAKFFMTVTVIVLWDGTT